MSKVKTQSALIPHLLRRAGFGTTPDELAYYQGLGYDKTLDELLKADKVNNDKLDDLIKAQNFDFTRLEDLKPLVAVPYVFHQNAH